MKLYTIFTPSHRIFYDQYFLPTVPKDFDLVVIEDKEQLCENGSYYSCGWTETCRKKIDLFYKACTENFGKYFFYCDVDVQFFNNNLINILLEEIDTYDIACQDDIICYNSGVFICKSNQRTLDMFRFMRDKYLYDDQKTLNSALYLCKYKKLSRKFFTTGYECKLWNNQEFNIPKDIVLHHANWVVGINNKIKVLDIVKNKYELIKSLQTI